MTNLQRELRAIGSTWIGALLVAAALLAATSESAAGDAIDVAGRQFPLTIDNSYIGADALSNVRGRAAINISAGDSNAQTNAAALAVGAGGTGFVGARTHIDQRTEIGRSQGGAEAAFAVIGGRAFATAKGLLSINQTSGAGNTQANSTAIGLGFGVEVAADNVLSATTSGAVPTGAGPAPSRIRGVSIAESAFEGAKGLVQVNQSAGTANSTANSFALRVQTGAGKP